MQYNQVVKACKESSILTSSCFNADNLGVEIRPVTNGTEVKRKYSGEAEPNKGGEQEGKVSLLRLDGTD